MRRKSARSLIVRALLLLSQLVRAGDACGLDFAWGVGSRGGGGGGCGCKVVDVVVVNSRWGLVVPSMLLPEVGGVIGGV